MQKSISIWWFSGLILALYGFVILAAGLWELIHPLSNPPVLNRLHAPIWWGALLAAIGLWYTIRFRPRNSAGSSNSKD